MITMKVYFEAIRGSDVVFSTCESEVYRLMQLTDEQRFRAWEEMEAVEE